MSRPARLARPGGAAWRALMGVALLLVAGAAPGLASRAAPRDTAGTSPDALTVSRALMAKLVPQGRGEASVTVTRLDPLGGPPAVQQGRLALEPPDRLRLDFPATGERIAVRRDGGEWVQPAVRQLVRLRREQAALAAWLWEVFLAGGAQRFREDALGARRFRLAPRDSLAALPARMTVRLDPRGLPDLLEVEEDGDGVRYQFRDWRFAPPRGAAAFVLAPPAGYTVVDLP